MIELTYLRETLKDGTKILRIEITDDEGESAYFELDKNLAPELIEHLRWLETP